MKCAVKHSPVPASWPQNRTIVDSYLQRAFAVDFEATVSRVPSKPFAVREVSPPRRVSSKSFAAFAPTNVQDCRTDLPILCQTVAA